MQKVSLNMVNGGLELQQSVNEVSSQLAEKAPKSDIITITTQLADKANESEVRKKSVLINEMDISDTLKQQITGNAPVLQTIADKVISRRKTNFIKSKNVFDKDAATAGYLSGTGTIIADAGWRTSDLLQFSESDVLRSSGNIAAYATYDVQGVFLARVTGLAVKEITIPAGVYYIRVQFGQTLLNTMVITKNETVPTLYIPYDEKIDLDLIGNLEKTAFKEFDVDFNELSFTKTTNKFDKTKIVSGQYVSYIDGTPLANAAYGWLFMPVEGGKTYIRNYPNQHFAWFDANNNLIANPIAPQTTPEIVAPANAVKIGYSTLLTQVNLQMFVEGTSLPAQYVSYQEYIPKTLLDPELLVSDPIKNLINVPSKIHAVAGMGTTAHFENLMNKPANKDIDVVATKGFHYDTRYTYTPAAAETVPLTFAIYEDGKMVNSKNTTLEVRAASEVTSNFKAVMIGDSNTNAGVYTQKMLDLFAADTYSDLALVGTRGTAPNLHEGRSGWSTAVYTKYASLSGVTNAFWNPATSKFDFPYYAAQNGVSGLTHAFIALGTNDVFIYNNDADLMAGVVTCLNELEEMIDSIHAHNANIKVGVMLTMPPSGKQDDFATAYGAGATRWRFKRNYDYLLSEMIKKFDNRTGEKIFTVATNLPIDPQTDFAGSASTPAVHPNTAGYNKIGEQVYKFLKVVG